MNDHEDTPDSSNAPSVEQTGDTPTHEENVVAIRREVENIAVSVTSFVDSSGAFIEHIGHAPTHEEEVVAIRRKVDALTSAMARVDAVVARVDARVADTERKLDGLISMTARSPSGVTLINLVQQIHNMIRKEFD